MTEEKGAVIDRDAIWAANEAAGLPNPFCFADAGEGCYMETVSTQTLELLGEAAVPGNCKGCRGYRWLREHRAAAAR